MESSWEVEGVICKIHGRWEAWFAKVILQITPLISSGRPVGWTSCDSDWSLHNLHGEVDFHMICCLLKYMWMIVAIASQSHIRLKGCWNLVHVAHLVNSKACTIIVPYCQDKERLSCLNMGVSYHSKIDACERKGDCWYTHAQPAHFRVNYRVTCDLASATHTCTTGCYRYIFIFVLCQWRFSFDCLIVTVLLQSNRQFQPAW
jgi:hypothetical protein